MTDLKLTLIALGLAADAFAVAVATSITLANVSPRQVFRLSFHFGLFQALMPVLGWWAGHRLGGVVDSWDHWLAFSLLGYVGGRAVYEALAGDKATSSRGDPTRGRSLVFMSVATSIDAFAVGVVLALSQTGIWYPALIIGCVAASLTLTGMLIGARLGAHFGQRVAVVGGVILIGIGVKILFQG